MKFAQTLEIFLCFLILSSPIISQIDVMGNGDRGGGGGQPGIRPRPPEPGQSVDKAPEKSEFQQRQEKLDRQKCMERAMLFGMLGAQAGGVFGFFGGALVGSPGGPAGVGAGAVAGIALGGVAGGVVGSTPFTLYCVLRYGITVLMD